LTALPAVRNNIDDLAELFTDDTYGIVPPGNCTVLRDERSVPSIGRKIRSAAGAAEDLLLVYFSGHGLKGGRQHELYLATYDSDPIDPDLGSLRYETLRSLVLDSQAKAKVVILDCCFSGRAFGDEMAGPEAVVDDLQMEGTLLLASSQSSSVSLSLPNEEHTAFTGRLIKILREGVGEREDHVSLNRLYSRLLSMMKQQGLPQPIMRGSRTVGQLGIAPNRAYTSITTDTLAKRFRELLGDANNGEPWLPIAQAATALHMEQVETLGQSHEQTLKTLRLSLLARSAAGDPQGAGMSLEAVLGNQEIVPAGSQDEIAVRVLLATALAASGDHERAISILRTVVPQIRRELGYRHSAALRSQHLLSRSLAAKGYTDEASVILEEVAAVSRSDRTSGSTILRDVESDMACLATVNARPRRLA